MTCYTSSHHGYQESDPRTRRYWELAHSCRIGDVPPNDHCLSNWEKGKSCKKNLTLLASASVMGITCCNLVALMRHPTANQPVVRKMNRIGT